MAAEPGAWIANAGRAERPASPPERASARLARLPIFSAEDYLALNPDIAAAGADPLEHALRDGIPEGRPLFTELALARAYGWAAQQPSLPDASPPRCPPPAVKRHRCSVFVHSRSEAAAREAAAALMNDLAADGIAATLRDESADRGGDHGTAVFVAPHDFFNLGLGPLWNDPAILADGIVHIDEAFVSGQIQPVIGPLLQARGVIDASAVGIAVWRAAGIPALHRRPPVPLRQRWIDEADLSNPLMRAAPPSTRVLSCDPLEWERRPLDVLFFDRHSPRSDARLGRLAAALAPHRCYIYTRQDVRGTVEERIRRDAHQRIAGHLSTAAKLTLHVSDDRLPSLDRRRIVEQAMAGGSVVVSDIAFIGSDLRPDVHYLRDAPHRLGDLIGWLLLDPDGQRTAERIRERAFDWIASNNRATGRATALGAFIRGDR